MNLMNRFVSKKEKLQIHHTDSLLVDKITDRTTSWFPSVPREYVVICIGTDRSTGDALGPLAGSHLADMKLRHLHLYGTLTNPVHATNIVDYIQHIHYWHKNPYIIAVDASLGKPASVGTIMTSMGAVSPGAALNKKLPSIGDIHMTGVVNISGFMEHATLQNTRLALVVQMAQKIAAILETIDQKLTYTRSVPTVLTQHSFNYQQDIYWQSNQKADNHPL
ncbi:spore protease YyaC [Barrientosiimonas marina]|uniref:Spore protease YyaC n=1 Tax=Lentibacillus kimchii TaxID=1542911 RepID=A0ABW2UV59_9BACI